MKETIEFIKKLLSNKRTRALAILIIYAIFFVFVFMLISSGETGPHESLEEPEETLPSFELADVTDYLIEITGEESFTYDAVTNLINYEDVSYPLDEKPAILDDYDLDIFKPSNISKLLDVAILESTNHLEQTNTYLVKISDFEKIIYNNDVINDDNIRIITYTDNSLVIVDLSNYYGYLVNIELRD